MKSNEKRRVYMDNNATTQIHPEVFEAMLPFLKERFGNPSSGHWFGRILKEDVESARESVASLLNAEPNEIYFCGGGSVADNMAIKGTAWNYPNDYSKNIVTTSIEHPAVLETSKYLSKNGYNRTIIGVDETAMIKMNELKSALDENTIIVSVMHGNNEVGTIQPLKEIGEIVKEKGITFHSDGVQTVGKIPVDVKDLNLDMLSLSGHKVHGPKGIGAIYIKEGTKLHSLISGGHHERGRRAGTENVAGIVGLGKACEIAKRDMEKDSKHLTHLRDELERKLLEAIPNIRINGNREHRLPNTLNATMECVEGETLLIQLDMRGIAISTGSACSSGSLDPSHVLTAMGIPQELIHGSLRFSLGRENTMEDIDYVVKHLPQVVQIARDISPLWGANGPIPIEDL